MIPSFFQVFMSIVEHAPTLLLPPLQGIVATID